MNVILNYTISRLDHLRVNPYVMRMIIVLIRNVYTRTVAKASLFVVNSRCTIRLVRYAG